MPFKACTGCGLEKPPEAFYWTKRRSGVRARHSRCIDCRRQQFQAWAKTPRGRERKRAGIMLREYGLTDAQYQEMLARQGGVCAICMRTEIKLHHTGSSVRLCVDHDHESGRPRALLCSGCNVGLGSFKDDPRLLRAAAAYIEDQKGQAAKTEALEAAAKGP